MDDIDIDVDTDTDIDIGVDPKKLEHGPGTICARVPSCFGLG